MRKLFSTLAAITLIGIFFPACAFGQENAPLAAEADAVRTTEHPADVLDPPPLPKLDKGEWKSEKAVFSGALSVEDEQGNPLDKTVDLPGTKYSAHLEYKRNMDALDDDLMNGIASNYDKALADKYFNYRVKIPGSSYVVAGASADGPQGGVYGQSVIAQGKLRFIAVSTNEPDRNDYDVDGQQAPPKEMDVKGDIEIFVSDEILLPDLIQKISAKDKMEAPESKE